MFMALSEHESTARKAISSIQRTVCPEFLPLWSGRKRKEVATKFCQDRRVNPAWAGCSGSVRCGARTETTRDRKTARFWTDA